MTWPGSVQVHGAHAGGPEVEVGLLVGPVVGSIVGSEVGTAVVVGAGPDVAVEPAAGVALAVMPPESHIEAPLGLTRHQRPPKLITLFPFVSPGFVSPW